MKSVKKQLYTDYYKLGVLLLLKDQLKCSLHRKTFDKVDIVDEEFLNLRNCLEDKLHEIS